MSTRGIWGTKLHKNQDTAKNYMKNANNLFNHLKVMKDEVLGKVQANPSLLNTSWKRIPDISDCKLSEPIINELLYKVGIRKVIKRKKLLNLINWRRPTDIWSIKCTEPETPPEMATMYYFEP